MDIVLTIDDINIGYLTRARMSLYQGIEVVLTIIAMFLFSID